MDEAVDEAVNEENQGMRLRTAFKAYAICLGIFIAVVTLAIISDLGFLGLVAAFFVYCGCGIYLNRSILRKLIEWHPLHNTILEVSNAKLNQAAFWPFSYLSLFIHMGINKVL